LAARNGRFNGWLTSTSTVWPPRATAFFCFSRD
jgi:hypothetical protein